MTREVKMKLISTLALLSLLATGVVRPQTQVPQRIVWAKTPIKLTLTLDKERQVHFPAPVRVGMAPEIDMSLRTQTVDGTVYLLAHQPFETTRVMVRELHSGQTYLLDIRAIEHDPGDATQAVEILSGHAPPVVEDQRPQQGSPPRREPMGYVSLTRFASQQMYAPRRLLHGRPEVTQVPLPESAREVSLVRGGAVRAIPLIAWRSGDLYVTAIKLTNTTARPVVLDPRRLRGRWLTATFQHVRLFPVGQEADTTCVYLVSARPFEAAL